MLTSMCTQKRSGTTASASRAVALRHRRKQSTCCSNAGFHSEQHPPTHVHYRPRIGGTKQKPDHSTGAAGTPNETHTQHCRDSTEAKGSHKPCRLRLCKLRKPGDNNQSPERQKRKLWQHTAKQRVTHAAAMVGGSSAAKEGRKGVGNTSQTLGPKMPPGKGSKKADKLSRRQRLSRPKEMASKRSVWEGWSSGVSRPEVIVREV